MDAGSAAIRVGEDKGQPLIRRPRLSLKAVAVASLGLGGMLILAIALLSGPAELFSAIAQPETREGSTLVPAVVADHPTNGKIEFTIPQGAAELQFSGGTPYIMPPVIRFRVSDTVVVRNNDVYPHMILNALAPADTTTTIAFDEPGTFAFSSGCTANGGTMNSFTTVIVSS